MTKANGRKPLNIELSDAERVLLDGIRARLGLRSLGEAVRELISYAVKGEVPPGFEYVPLPDGRVRALKISIGPEFGGAALVKRTAVEKAKREPIKSRLKGEWKAP